MASFHKLLSCISISIALIAIHFFVTVYTVGDVEQDEKSYKNIVLHEVVTAQTVSGKKLAELYGIVYVEPEPPEGVNPEEKGSQKEILLNDVAVVIRAISKINEVVIVYVEYQDGQGTQKVKLEQGQSLLGHQFISAIHNVLIFERNGIQSQYQIFKSSQKK